jgi:hypothetical protein
MTEPAILVLTALMKSAAIEHAPMQQKCRRHLPDASRIQIKPRVMT